eukprot:Skav200714  [mRNA]  locus=scaffold2650:104505:105443:- [translate_table: standard]
MPAFFSDDKSEEVQIQGRTARQGKKGTYSLILAEQEVKDLGLDPAILREKMEGASILGSESVYKALCGERMKKQAGFVEELEDTLKEANSFDSLSHFYFNALLERNSALAKDRLKELYQKLGAAQAARARGGPYHCVCCYDESGSMYGKAWKDLKEAHLAFMQTLQGDASTRVSIVQFATESRTVLELGDVQEAERINLVNKDGGTKFRPALKEALRLIEAGHDKYPLLTPVLLFMSDGDNDDDGDCTKNVTDIQKKFPALVFHAVIFNEPDSKTLRKMADATNGMFHVSADGLQLVKTFSTIGSSLEYTGR